MTKSSGGFCKARLAIFAKQPSLLVWLLLAVVCPVTASAVGLRLPSQDPEAVARGNAFVATADNPSAIYYNPAGITQLEGNNVRVGIYAVSASIDYESRSGARATTDSTLQPVPEFYYVYTPKACDFSFGLGVYAPYGLAVDWGDSPPFAPIARKGKLIYATINAVVAWKIHPKLSLAVGPTVNYADADLQNASFNFKGDDTGFGFTAGLMWKPLEKWSFGVKYHSATDIDLRGHSEVPAFSLGSSSTQAKAHFPQFIVGGISFRPTTNWNFEFDVDWTDWDSLNTVNFRRGDGVTVPFAFNYKSSFMYEVGATRLLGNGYFVSAGYFYSENSSPDANFNPIVPDSNLHLGSVGFGHHGQRWDWAIAYHFGYNPERQVQGSAQVLGDGTYNTFNQAVNVATTFRF